MKDPKQWKDAILNDLKRARKDFGRGIENAGKQSFRKTQLASRVRTGSFISNWNFTLDNPSAEFVDRRRLKAKSANLRLAKTKIDSFIEKNALEKAMYMTNASPYGGILNREDGYLEIAEAEFFSAIDKIKDM